MTPQETIRALAAHVKAAVFPHLGTWRARRITGTASSGDATFDIDDIAEAAVEQFIRIMTLMSPTTPRIVAWSIRSLSVSRTAF